LDVVGVGALNYDRLYGVPRIAEPGEEVMIESRFTGGGGSAANTIVGLARLGAATGFIGNVGNDPEGRILLEELKREGVDTGGVSVVEGDTGEIIGLVDRGGERVLYAYPGVNNALVIDESRVRYAGEAKYLHLSSFVGDASYRSQKSLLGEVDSRITFSPGMLYARRGLRELRDVIGQSYAVFLNRDELRLLTGGRLEEGAKRLLHIGAEIVVVTLGKDGCYVFTNKVIKIPGYPAVAVDTTGAGDAFVAGFIYGLLADLSLKGCGMLGNKLASLCVEAFGARTSLPRKEELREFISSLE
jgi:ribokinase